MANYYSVYSSFFLFIALFLILSGKAMAGCNYLSTVGGGCPNKYECLETCKPCYRGIGLVKAGCVTPSGPTPYWECRCYFRKGAPCPPPGPPRCPRKWPQFVSSTNLTSHHETDPECPFLF